MVHIWKLTLRSGLAQSGISVSEVEGSQLGMVMERATDVEAIDDVIYPSSGNDVDAVEQPLLAKVVDITNSTMFEEKERKLIEGKFIDSLARGYSTSIPMAYPHRIPVELTAKTVLLLDSQKYFCPEEIMWFGIWILYQKLY